MTPRYFSVNLQSGAGTTPPHSATRETRWGVWVPPNASSRRSCSNYPKLLFWVTIKLANHPHACRNYVAPAFPRKMFRALFRLTLALVRGRFSTGPTGINSDHDIVDIRLTGYWNQVLLPYSSNLHHLHTSMLSVVGLELTDATLPRLCKVCLPQTFKTTATHVRDPLAQLQYILQ